MQPRPRRNRASLPPLTPQSVDDSFSVVKDLHQTIAQLIAEKDAQSKVITELKNVETHLRAGYAQLEKNFQANKTQLSDSKKKNYRRADVIKLLRRQIGEYLVIISSTAPDVPTWRTGPALSALIPKLKPSERTN